MTNSVPFVWRAGAYTRATAGRRAVARTIDLLAVGVTVFAFTTLAHRFLGWDRAGGAYLCGLGVGYGWLAVLDWGATSLGKGICKLAVVDANTGGEPTLLQSIRRNLPWIVTALPLRVHQGLLGMDRATYRAEHSQLVLVFTVVAGVLFLALVVGPVLGAAGRHVGDRLAGTLVIERASSMPDGGGRD